MASLRRFDIGSISRKINGINARNSVTNSIPFPCLPSQEKMVYVPAEQSTDGIAKVVYKSKDGKSRKVFTALD